MLKYQISGDMIRAKMRELLELYPNYAQTKDRKELYHHALDILREKMVKKKAENAWTRPGRLYRGWTEDKAKEL